MPVMVSVCCLFFGESANAQKTVPVFDGFVVVSYNVENLFDTINNPNTADDDFAPDGGNRWDSWRYRIKLRNIWKVLAATNLCNFPDVIGLCEVENRAVVEDLITWTPLWKGHYSIMHKDSRDRRGIDLALLYNAKTFRPLDSAFVPVTVPDEPDFATRDIMYVKGLVTATGDTLHIFLNHWPSRYGGFAWTEPYRCRAARVLRETVDSVLTAEKNARIICMGDFNDTPFDKSVNEDLGAKTDFSNPKPGELYNISYCLAHKKKMWSYWYQGHGDLLDQVMVSGSMLGVSGFHLNPDNVFPLDEPNFMDKDGRPLRTYQGPVYKGGYSDHLPIIINIELE